MRYSFIVPVYNCSAYLEDCVSSILAQTYKDYEIILVDDGSTDNSGTLCDDFAEKYPCVRALHKENGGVSQARNLGIQSALGEYLIFVDGDDTLEENYLQQADILLSQENVQLVILGVSFDFYRKDCLIRKELRGIATYDFLDRHTVRSDFVELFYKNMFSSSCAKVFLASVIWQQQIRFDENMRHYEDLHFTLQYLRHVEKIGLLPDGYYHYRIRLDANRYYSRISDLERLNYMLGRVYDAAIPFGSGAALSIVTAIANQAIMESAQMAAFRPAELFEKAARLRKLPQVQRIYGLNQIEGVTAPTSLTLVCKGQKWRLWFFAMYKVLRGKLASFVKKLIGWHR